MKMLTYRENNYYVINFSLTNIWKGILFYVVGFQIEQKK